jgi:MoaA/NifB/PqqE/SkfB family radical SAM enzyme
MLERFIFAHPFKVAGWYPSWAYPRMLAIALTRKCNLSCFMCRSPDEIGEDLPFEKLIKLRRAIRHAQIIEFCGEGESLAYPWINDTIEYIYSLNHKKDLLRIFTNGTPLSAKMAALIGNRIHYLRVSLNAATPETYRLVTRHGDLDSTISNVSAFLSGIDETDKLRIHLHFVASTLNYKEIPAYIFLSQKLGIHNVSIRNIEISKKELVGYSLLAIQSEYDATILRARKLASELEINLDARTFSAGRPITDGADNSVQVQNTWIPPKCEMLKNAFVELDGGISPCNNSGPYRIGNVYRDGFEKVWFSDEYISLRRKQYMPACDRCIYCMPLNDKAAHFTCHFKDES